MSSDAETCVRRASREGMVTMVVITDEDEERRDDGTSFASARLLSPTMLRLVQLVKRTQFTLSLKL